MAKKLWGSRFTKKTNTLADKFSSSIADDQRLAKYDILGSIAHVKMLQKQKIIGAGDSCLIIKGLKSILKDVETNKFKFDPQAEDIHSNIQNALFKKIGKPAQKLHTGRSRNDQIVLDEKMYLKEEIKNLKFRIKDLQGSILGFAIGNQEIIIPGYTHLQLAQPLLLAHYLLVYLEGLKRDSQRLNDVEKRTDLMPLGSCAFSGTSLFIDREYVKRELGFKGLTQNSLDSVSDRDFILEFLADLSILSVRLSRIAEDLILWSTQEFNFIDIDFSFCTGSSIMPHKKNPDVLELIRGYAGKISADFLNVLILIKGLPLSYNRDLQLDKPPLFDAIDTIKEVLEILTPFFRNIKIKKESVAARLKDESLFSVDIVEYLIKKGLSYRKAHDLVGEITKDCLDKGRKISSLSEAELRRYSPQLDLDVKDILSPTASIGLKISFGSTAPKMVRQQLEKWKKKLGFLRD